MIDTVRLRDLDPADLSLFFEHQLDADANWMAAFTAKDPADRAAFDAHWRKILADERIVLKTILYGEEVAGYIMVHPWFGEPEMSYWLGKAHWGQGIATAALSAFLEIVTTRPLHARVAQDNLASRRVLEKCEFTITGEDKGFANARGEEVDEWILILDR
jgi:RimJ/RimL family protein N-acetyltransferase